MIKKDTAEQTPEEQEGQEQTQNDATDENTAAEEKPKSKKKLSKSKQLEEDLEKSKLEVVEAKDKYLRLFAEFDNYKKRSIKEKLEFMRTASQDTINAILPVIDDFDRAKKSADDDSSVEQFSEGVTMVYNKLHSVLKNLGVEAMESTGEVFDPELHAAVTEISAPSEDMKGKIIDTIEKGYLLKEKIIRHAKVVVGK